MSGENPTNSDLARTLGIIQANQDNIRREFERERDGASDHRRALRETIAALSEAVRTLAAQMKDILPLAYDYRETRDQELGAARLKKSIWAAVIAGSAFFGALLGKAIDHFK